MQVIEIDWNDFEETEFLGWKLAEEYKVKGTDKKKYIGEMRVGDMLESGFPYEGSYIMRIG